MNRLFINLILVLVTLYTHGQTNSFLVTIENKTSIQELKTTFTNLEVELAFPNSKQALFNSVYRIKATEGQTASVLKHLTNNVEFKNIEEEEEILLLQTPNDYSIKFANDYALDLINAKGAWEITTGDSDIIIGISDSNFDQNHKELVGAFTTEVTNFFHTNINHGTAVAITAAGNTNNVAGKSAIGYNTKMILERISYNSLLNLSYAGAKVINASWASGCTYNDYHQQIINEIYENGTIIVAAAGNGSTCYGPESLVYPAAYEHVISVSSIGPNDNHERIIGNVHSTHQHNESVDLVAPGYDVAIGIANNSYTTGNGTSFAAPYVSGAIGLMLSVNPCLTYEDVLDILSRTAVDIYPLNPIYTGLLGAGRLDAAAAVEMAKNYASFNFEITSEYNCENDQYSLNITPQDTDYETSIEWEDGTNEWSLYNKIEGHYNFTIKRPYGCDIDTFVYYVPTQPIYDYTNSVILNYAHITLHDFNGDGVIRIKGLLVVESGVTYNLSNKNIEFGYNNDLPCDLGYQNSGIVIKPGGKLIIDNCQFSSVENCNEEWDGIELWGNYKDTVIGASDAFQAKSNENLTSELTITNSTLSNAETGIRNFRKSIVFGITPNQKEICGIVNINNTKFYNNNVGIELREHHNNQLLHTVSNTEFNANNQIEVTHIKLLNINTIEIHNTSFHGNSSALLSDRGTAIHATNSSINSKKESVNTLQETKNSYQDLFEGIYLTNTNKSKCIFVVGDIFSNVHRGIYLSGNIKTVIDNSIFNLSVGTETLNSFALMTSSINQLKVINSSIYGGASQGATFGFVLKENLESKIDLIGNDFIGHIKSGMQFEGENHNVDISCNMFDLIGEFDLSIAPGAMILNNNLSLNTFSACGNVTANIVNDANNDPFIYSTSSNNIPNCVSDRVTIDEKETYIDWGHACEYGYEYDLVQLDPQKEPNTFTPTEVEKNPGNTKEVYFNTSPASINEQEGEIKIYPNPTQSNFTIQASGLKTGVQIVIYNQMGAITRNFNLSSEVESYEIEGLESGAYTVLITNKNGNPQYGKVIVQ